MVTAARVDPTPSGPPLVIVDKRLVDAVSAVEEASRDTILISDNRETLISIVSPEL